MSPYHFDFFLQKLSPGNFSLQPRMKNVHALRESLLSSFRFKSFPLKNIAINWVNIFSFTSVWRKRMECPAARTKLGGHQQILSYYRFCIELFIQLKKFAFLYPQSVLYFTQFNLHILDRIFQVFVLYKQNRFFALRLFQKLNCKREIIKYEKNGSTTNQLHVE